MSNVIRLKPTDRPSILETNECLVTLAERIGAVARETLALDLDAEAMRGLMQGLVGAANSLREAAQAVERGAWRATSSPSDRSSLDTRSDILKVGLPGSAIAALDHAR